SAEQRKGRAGRTAPGTCYRLWTESGQLNRPERNTPEIQRSDLAETVLLLHSLGIKRAAEFDWLDKPDPQAVERAERLLRTLGALTDLRFANDDLRASESTPDPSRQGNLTDTPRGLLPSLGKAGRRPASVGARAAESSDLTEVGRQMLRLPMHPRYSRMLVEAAQHGCVPAAALCAALVSGRDLLMRLGRDDQHIAGARELFEASQESDFFTLMRAYHFARNCNFSVEQCRRYGIHAQTARQVDQTFEQIMQLAVRNGLVEGRRPTGEAEGAAAGQSPPITDEGPRTKSNLETRNPQSTGDPLLKCILAGFLD